MGSLGRNKYQFTNFLYLLSESFNFASVFKILFFKTILFRSKKSRIQPIEESPSSDNFAVSSNVFDGFKLVIFKLMILVSSCISDYSLQKFEL